MSRAVKTVALFLGLVLIGALALWGYRAYRGRGAAALAQWHVDSVRVAEATATAVREQIQAGIVYDTTRLTYTRWRDSIIRVPGGITSRESTTFAKCDQVVTTCEQRHAADTTVIHALRDELKVARAKPSLAPQRLTLWGAGMYDLLHAEPVARAGATLHLFGPIAASAEGELARSQQRALVGFKYTF